MCGLYGFSNYRDTMKPETMNCLLDALGCESAARGRDATGIAYLLDGKLEIEKKAKSAEEATFKLPKDTAAVIGHTRHATQGSELKNFNNHPFKGKLKNGSMFALAHNGILSNDKSLRAKLKLPSTKIETDSYIAVQLLEKYGKLDMDSLAKMAEDVMGSFTFAILDDANNVYVVKGDSPLSILHFKELGLYVYASTERILWRALASTPLLGELKKNATSKTCIEEVELKPGQILKISPSGKLDYGEFEYTAPVYYSPYALPWWGCMTTHDRPRPEHVANKEYVEELKAVAKTMGFKQDDIDYLLETGWTPEEIEEYMYAGDECECMGEY